MPESHEVVIVGSGPAGLTAAVYAARADLEPIVIEGLGAGGQLMLTTEVENYPGFPEGIMGPELMQKMRDQAERFGTRYITDQATQVELAAEPGGVHKVWVGDDVYETRTVILAMGAEHKKLEVRGETELSGRGVSYCATCDAAFFKERSTIIVGGGDSAMEEAIFLAKFSSTVTIVNRRDEFRASKIMLERARAVENIEFLTPYVPVEFVAGEDGKIATVRLQHAETGEAKQIDVGGVFVAIGHRPRSELVQGQVELDDEGYVMVDEPSTKTKLAGVFAVGDLVDHTYRQAVTAAGSGTKGALDAEWYLRDMPPDPEEHWGTNTGAIVEAVEAS